jgi:hypothetical protein
MAGRKSLYTRVNAIDPICGETTARSMFGTLFPRRSDVTCRLHIKSSIRKPKKGVVIVCSNNCMHPKCNHDTCGKCSIQLRISPLEKDSEWNPNGWFVIEQKIGRALFHYSPTGQYFDIDPPLLSVINANFGACGGASKNVAANEEEMVIFNLPDPDDKEESPRLILAQQSEMTPLGSGTSNGNVNDVVPMIEEMPLLDFSDSGDEKEMHLLTWPERPKKRPGTAMTAILPRQATAAKRHHDKSVASWPGSEPFSLKKHAGVDPSQLLPGEQLCRTCTFVYDLSLLRCPACNDHRADSTYLRSTSELASTKPNLMTKGLLLSFPEDSSYNCSESDSEESVIVDEYSTGEESSDSDDSISAFLAEIKQSGRKPPARRKCGLIKSRKQLHHKGGKRSKKKISRLKQAENANANYWGCHCPSIGVTDPGKLWLVLFIPQSSDCEPNGSRCCRSPQSHRNSLRLDDPGSVEEFVSEIHCIQKAPCQVTFNRGLHVKLHAVTEESGIAWVNAELSPLVKGGLVKFPNTMDHFYNPLHPEWPLVINTNNVKVCSGDSLLTHLTGRFKDLLVHGLHEIVKLGNANSRGVLQLNLGYSPNQANNFMTTNEFSPSRMGFTDASTKATPSLLHFAGDVMFELTNTVADAILCNTPQRNFFKGSATRTKMFTTRLYNLFQVPDNRRIGRFAEALAINVVPLVPSAEHGNVDIHYDASDDIRENHDGHMVGATKFLLRDLIKDLDTTMKDEIQSKLKITVQNYIYVTFIAYTRKLAGEQCDKADGKNQIQDQSALELYSLLTSPEESLGFTAHFDNEDIDIRARLMEYHRSAVPAHDDEEFPGRIFCRPECLSLDLFMSSFIHAVFMLLTSQTCVRPTYATMRDFLVILVDTSGQQRFYCIFNKWVRGKSCYSDDKLFSTAYAKCPDLVKLYSIETMHFNRNRRTKNKKGESVPLIWHCNTDNNRYQISGDLIWKESVDPVEAASWEKSLQDRRHIIDEACIILRKSEQFDEALSQKAYEILENGNGMGHMKAQLGIRGAGYLGLGFDWACEFGALQADTRSSTGPAKFIMEHTEIAGEWTNAHLKSTWNTILDNLRNEANLDVFPAILDQGMCCGSRIFRQASGGRIVDKRKSDLIIWDSQEFTSLQNIFRYKYKTRTPLRNRLQFRYHDKWRDLSDIRTIHRTPGIPDSDKHVWLEWIEPKWSREIPGGYKRGMVQSVFKEP